MNSKIFSIIIIAGVATGGVATGLYFIASDNDAGTASKMSVQNLKPYDYENICGFPVTDEMRLNIIREESTDFTTDGMSYLTVRGANFTHVELSQYNHDVSPALQYWFELKNGKQVYFEIGACDIGEPDVTLGTTGPTYLKPIPENCENEFEKMSIPGFPRVNCHTMEPVLDTDNCKGIADYYTKMQSHVMFTRENVTFDPLWKNIVFPLMDYCNDMGSFEMDVIDEKIEWSFIS